MTTPPFKALCPDTFRTGQTVTEKTQFRHEQFRLLIIQADGIKKYRVGSYLTFFIIRLTTLFFASPYSG